ncbi:uncharacterized protein LOC125187729 [Salvia hispanica]|uniref:uncharacterized protein LOC125187729 n=1 Tax=Salvia hispanica TaxID=49212 RepID=UPI00200965AA|nr:uncharacterized protein LOC125187729 [Salvia hispanica]
MILKAVADHRLWIWHAYFGVAGSNNDINVLNSSTLFADQCRSRGLAIKFTAKGCQYHMGYYLADGIYTRWLVFVKTISCPMGDRRVLFAAKQESARKDVERAFGSNKKLDISPIGSMMKVDLAPARQPRLSLEVLERQISMRSQQDHAALMNDMIEEVWKRNGH